MLKPHSHARQNGRSAAPSLGSLSRRLYEPNQLFSCHDQEEVLPARPWRGALRVVHADRCGVTVMGDDRKERYVYGGRREV